MITRRRYGTTILLPAFVALLAATALLALGWHGLGLIERDRELENIHRNSQLTSAATLLTGEMERSLGAWSDLLKVAGQGADVTLQPDTVLVIIDSSGVLSRQGVHLPYFPQVSPHPEASKDIFAATDALEVGQQDLLRAAESYRRIASSEDRAVRATALLGLARCLRNLGRMDEALAAYAELGAMDATNARGRPAALVAAQQRAALFTTMGNSVAMRHEMDSLAALLWQGRFIIDRATFDHYSSGIPEKPPEDNAFRLAQAVEDMWPQWTKDAEGRAAWSVDGLAIATVWRRTPTGTAAIVGSIDSLMASSAVAGIMGNLSAAVSLEGKDGRPIWGVVPAGSVSVEKRTKETGLPWTIRVALLNSATGEGNAVQRRNLTVAALALAVLVIGIGSYLVLRTVNREIKVARLQSDFVAAVSHEFRSPLTVMRHLTDLLEEGGTPVERMPRYFQALGKETRRLQSMVESLLDFGRMEAGRRTYRMEDSNAVEWTRQVVDEFRERTESNAHRLEIDATAEPLPIRVDRDAVALALGNLLDNAVKYSPAASLVRVSVQRKNGFAGISVEDQGPGIPQNERREIFRKFSRGAAARSLNIKGTGIGLTIADYIVKAHGGRLELTDAAGRGCRFTIFLPVKDRS